jgi:hypothetical protein
MVGVVAGAGAGFHWMNLETRRGSSETKRYLEKVVEKSTITTSGECQRGSLRLRRWPGAYCCYLPLSFLEYWYYRREV